jgi:hypothetical protein
VITPTAAVAKNITPKYTGSMPAAFTKGGRDPSGPPSRCGRATG